MQHKHDDTDDQSRPDGYVLPRSNYTVQPGDRTDAAADLIRDKLSKLYAEEPDAAEEERQAEIVKPRSRHQQFMHELNHSGKDLAQIQTEWHQYYMGLDNISKHEVWQEFYSNNQATAQTQPSMPAHTPTHTEKLADLRNESAGHQQKHKQAAADKRSADQVQRDIKKAARRRPTAKQHFQSLLFGLGVGALTLFIFLFSFFNEFIIAPFIQPGRTAVAAPLIVNGDTVAPSKEPQIVIPKINVQIPIVFGGTTINPDAIASDLDKGVVHYPTTSDPGQNGNSAYFGHSSNNIFNKGKYKFAFVLLNQLVPGDTFYITKNEKVYAYKVFQKQVVDPSRVDVLNPVPGHAAVATLITCDPPGTTLRRLIVHADQVSPDPAGNSAPDTASLNAAGNSETLVGNGKTLWGRFISTTTGKMIMVVVAIVAIILFFRLTAPKPKR